MSSKKSRMSGSFSLGSDQAEADPLLSEAFYSSGNYQAIESRLDPRCFVVGRTGSGKSAALQRLAESRPDHVIRINPEDLSLPYITNLSVVRFLDSLDVKLDPLFIALWKHVILVEIIRKRYHVDSPAAKRNFFDALKLAISNDSGKRAALEYLDEFESKFWCETDERVKDITASFSEKIRAEAGASLGNELLGSVGASISSDRTAQSAVSSQVVERFQKIVNDTQLARLNKMIAVLDEDILASPQDAMYIVIDDLDRDWVDESLSNDLIRCLFRTVLDLKRVRNLKIVVALRTNIFEELDFGKKSAGQEEKFRSLVLQMRWTRAELVEVLDERVKVASRRSGVEATALADLLPIANRKRGNPVDYILDRTLLRPRDAIAFANECLALGGGKTRVAWTEIARAESSYSSNRLLALRDEWKVTYPGIDKVLEAFRGAPTTMDRIDVARCLDSAMLVATEPNPSDLGWILELSKPAFEPGSPSWEELYGPFLRFLFRIGFIGARTHATGAPTFNTDDEQYLRPDSRLAAARTFFVHRAYSSALDLRQLGAQQVSDGAEFS